MSHMYMAFFFHFLSFVDNVNNNNKLLLCKTEDEVANLCLYFYTNRFCLQLHSLSTDNMDCHSSWVYVACRSCTSLLQTFEQQEKNETLPSCSFTFSWSWSPTCSYNADPGSGRIQFIRYSFPSCCLLGQRPRSHSLHIACPNGTYAVNYRHSVGTHTPFFTEV